MEPCLQLANATMYAGDCSSYLLDRLHDVRFRSWSDRSNHILCHFQHYLDPGRNEKELRFLLYIKSSSRLAYHDKKVLSPCKGRIIRLESRVHFRKEIGLKNASGRIICLQTTGCCKRGFRGARFIITKWHNV